MSSRSYGWYIFGSFLVVLSWSMIGEASSPSAGEHDDRETKHTQKVVSEKREKSRSQKTAVDRETSSPRPVDNQQQKQSSSQKNSDSSQGFSIVDSGFSIRKSTEQSRLLNDRDVKDVDRRTGTNVAVTAQSNEHAIIAFLPEKSELNRFADNRGKALLGSGKDSDDTRARFHQVTYSKEQKETSFFVHSKQVPSPEATKLELKGKLAFTVAEDTTAERIKNVKLQSGTTFRVPGIPVEGEITSSLHPEEETQLEIRFRKTRNREEAPAVVNLMEDVEVFDSRGNDVEVVHKTQSPYFPEWSITIAKRLDTMNLQVSYWSNLQEHTTPFRLHLDGSIGHDVSRFEPDFPDDIQFEPLATQQIREERNEKSVSNPFSSARGTKTTFAVASAEKQMVQLIKDGSSATVYEGTDGSMDFSPLHDGKKALLTVRSREEPAFDALLPGMQGKARLKLSSGKASKESALIDMAKNESTQVGAFKFTIFDSRVREAEEQQKNGQEENNILLLKMGVESDKLDHISKLVFLDTSGEQVPAKLYSKSRDGNKMVFNCIVKKPLKEMKFRVQSWQEVSFVDIPLNHTFSLGLQWIK